MLVVSLSQADPMPDLGVVRRSNGPRQLARQFHFGISNSVRQHMTDMTPSQGITVGAIERD
jgi:hypothetical protein